MRITMKEIAKMANVSQPTVSRVINGNGNVSKEIAERVMKVIEDVGYKPNITAQTLKRNCSFLIGVNVINISNPYFMDLIEALELEARKNGYNIILHNSNHNPLTEWENIENFMARQVDAIIIVPRSNDNLKKLQTLNVPTVVITQTKDYFDSVAISHKEGGRLVGEYFIKTGHRKFAYIGYANDDKFYGYQGALYDNGFDFEMKNLISIGEEANSNFDIHQDILRYLETNSNPDFTAVFTVNDIAALEFIRVMESLGKKIPEDFCVFGFDDTILAKSFGISSVHQPIKDMAKSAFKLLLNKINDSSLNETVSIELEPTLIVRRSSAK